MDDNGTLLAGRLKQLFKPSRFLTGFLALGTAGFFAFGAWVFYEGILWNSRLVSWKKVPGTIVEKKVDKKGNCRYEYEFLFNKRFYRGDKVIFSRTFSGYRKVGDKCTVLMDPEDPGKHALFAEPSFLGRILFYIQGVLFFFFCLVGCFGIFEYISDCRKNAQLPEKLRTYLNSFAPEVLEQLRLQERTFQPSLFMPLLVYEKAGILFFYGRRNRVGMGLFYVFHAGIIAAACLLDDQPLAAMLGVMVFLAVAADLKRFRAGVEFEKERFFIESTFMGLRRENKCYDFFFADIEYFLVTSAQKNRRGLGIHAAAVLKDGRSFILFSLPPDKRWRQGLHFLPELAEKCGRKPLVFDV